MFPSGCYLGRDEAIKSTLLIGAENCPAGNIERIWRHLSCYAQHPEKNLEELKLEPNVAHQRSANIETFKSSQGIAKNKEVNNCLDQFSDVVYLRMMKAVLANLKAEPNSRGMRE